MHADLSPDNAYFRFFNLSPRAPEREATRVSRPPDDKHLALLALLSGQLVGVATYEVSEAPDRAEIAFAVSDDMHGRGIATLLLEHLVSLGRQRNLTAFEAETLPDNYAMQRVFADAGLPVQKRFADGVIELTFPLPAADTERLDSYLDKVAVRASRAEVASLRHLFRARRPSLSSALAGSAARWAARSCTTSWRAAFPATVYAVNPSATELEGIDVPQFRAGTAGRRGHRGDRGAARGGRRRRGQLRPSRGAHARRDHRRAGERRARADRGVPPVRDAAGGAELLRYRGARREAERDVRGYSAAARRSRAW